MEVDGAGLFGILPPARVRCVIYFPTPPGSFVAGFVRYVVTVGGEARTTVGDDCDVACKRSMLSPATLLSETVALENSAAKVHVSV